LPVISEILLKNKLREEDFYSIMLNNGRKGETKTSTPEESRKRGNRAEVRRERKKRDILSPVNVLT
jgi:hypothetical protein